MGMAIAVIGDHSYRRDDRCERCKQFSDLPPQDGCHHTRDVAIVSVRRSGTFPMVDIVPPAQLAKLARWTNAQEQRQTNNRRAMRSVGGKL